MKVTILLSGHLHVLSFKSVSDIGYSHYVGKDTGGGYAGAGTITLN
jgi:hypothetical protein